MICERLRAVAHPGAVGYCARRVVVLSHASSRSALGASSFFIGARGIFAISAPLASEVRALQPVISSGTASADLTSPVKPLRNIWPILTMLTVPTALMRGSLIAALTEYPAPAQMPMAPMIFVDIRQGR
jgi:hypothetical protein